jgi:hypothetical protein
VGAHFTNIEWLQTETCSAIALVEALSDTDSWRCIMFLHEHGDVRANSWCSCSGWA